MLHSVMMLLYHALPFACSGKDVGVCVYLILNSACEVPVGKVCKLYSVVNPRRYLWSVCWNVIHLGIPSPISHYSYAKIPKSGKLRKLDTSHPSHPDSINFGGGHQCLYNIQHLHVKNVWKWRLSFELHSTMQKSMKIWDNILHLLGVFESEVSRICLFIR